MSKLPNYSTAFVLGVCLLGASVLAAEEVAESSLVKQSPFLPPGYNPKTVGGGKNTQSDELKTLELRGIMKWDGQWQFSLFDTKKNEGRWVKLRDETAPYYIADYDPTTRTINLKTEGRMLPLSVKKADSQPLAIAVREPAKPETKPSEATPAVAQGQNAPANQANGNEPTLASMVEGSGNKPAAAAPDQGRTVRRRVIPRAQPPGGQ